MRKITPALARRIIISATLNGDLVADDLMRAALVAISTRRTVTVGA